MKRLLSLLLVLAMLLTQLAPAASAAGTPTLVVSSAEASAGETVELTVDMENNPGINTFTLTVEYDKTRLSLTNVTLGSGLTGNFYFAPNTDTAVWQAMSDTTYCGTALNLSFAVLEDAPLGRASVSVSYKPGNVCNFDEEDVNFDISAGSVTVVEPQCPHANVTEVPAKSPDCTEPGHELHYICGDCGAVLSADGVTETTPDAVTIPALGHDFSVKTESQDTLRSEAKNCQEQDTYWYTCARCGEVSADSWFSGSEAGPHSFTEQIADEAHLVPGTGGDCQNGKHYYYDCAHCDAMGQTTWASQEVGEHVVATEWTTENGVHYHACTVPGCDHREDEASCSGGTATCSQKALCEICGQPWGELGGHEYAEEWSQGDETGHWHNCLHCDAHSEPEAHIPDIDAPTEEQDQLCVVCGYVIAEKLGHIHAPEYVEGKEPDCTTDGQKAHYECACGLWFWDAEAQQEIADQRDTVIKKLGHDPKVENAIPATCTEDGYTGDEVCARCGEQLSAGVPIPALGHQPETITIPEKEYTDTEPGNEEFRVDVCSECGIWLDERGYPLTEEEIAAIWEAHATYPETRTITLTLNGQEITGKVEWDMASQGEALTLIPDTEPSAANPEITWSTSSKTIATVENGTVTFKKPGTVKITAKANDGSGVKAVAEFKVIYRDAATKFTGKLAPETNLYGTPSKSGVQVGDSVNIQVFGTDKEVPLTGLTYEITSGKDYAEIEGSTLTALVAGKTVKVKAYYEGDPLKRSVTVSVKTIATKPGELSLTYGVDADLDEYGYILSDGMSDGTLLVKSGEAKTFDLDLSALDQAGEPLEDFGSITWTSSSTKIATVKNGAVTIKKGASGTVTITAKSKLDTKVLAKLTIDVVDYTPDVEKSTLTINTYIEGSYPLGIEAQEADPVTAVMFVDKNGEQIDKFTIEEIDGVWSIADPGQILKNASTKGKLILTTLHGQEEEITFTAKVSNKAPTITVKTTKKLNTKDPNGYAEITVTSKQGAIADIELESLTFDYSGEDGIYTLTPQPDVKLDKSGKITVWEEGYRYEVTKTLSVSTESVSNKAVLGNKTLTLDLSEGNAASTTLTSYFVDVDIADCTITTTNAQGKKLIVTFADGIITAAFGNELPKAGSYKFIIKATADDGTALKAVTLTVKVVK